MTDHAPDCDSLSPALLSAEQALEQLLDAAKPVAEVENVELFHALGRVLSAPVVSSVDVPPADNSAMDGYAVSSADLAEGRETCLPVAQRICAGDSGQMLETQTAARIFTGAPIPPGADAVIMQEQVRLNDGQACFSGGVKPGTNIRRAGEDIRADGVVLQPGVRLRPQELGLAASVGIGRLPVYRRVRVGVFFTGDELVEPGLPLAPGKIYDSNRYTLRGLLQAIGCEVVDLGIVQDRLEATREALQAAASQSDLVITSGGVSVGEEDHVRIALEEMGELHMWRIAMKPGKPLAFGQIDATPFLGLPGNPVSVFATFNLFAAPFIRSLQGMRRVLAEPMTVRAGFDWPRPGKRREYLRARLERGPDGHVSAIIYPHQGSGVLTSTSWADGLVVMPIGATVQAGDSVQYLPFTELL